MARKGPNQKRKKGDPPLPGAGRPKGSHNKSTLEVRELARVHGPAAIATLARIMMSRFSEERLKIAAADSLLDRGYGKAVQMLANDPDNPLPAMPSMIQLVAGDGSLPPAEEDE